MLSCEVVESCVGMTMCIYICTCICICICKFILFLFAFVLNYAVLWRAKHRWLRACVGMSSTARRQTNISNTMQTQCKHNATTTQVHLKHNANTNLNANKPTPQTQFKPKLKCKKERKIQTQMQMQTKSHWKLSNSKLIYLLFENLGQQFLL